eukprot:SAG11_NODE_2180_length_3714_cov_2.273306_4_plen_172_part_00
MRAVRPTHSETRRSWSIPAWRSIERHPLASASLPADPKIGRVHAAYLLSPLVCAATNSSLIHQAEGRPESSIRQRTVVGAQQGVAPPHEGRRDRPRVRNCVRRRHVRAEDELRGVARRQRGEHPLQSEPQLSARRVEVVLSHHEVGEGRDYDHAIDGRRKQRQGPAMYPPE